MKVQLGAVVIQTPRDCNGRCKSQLVKKGQTRLTQFDDTDFVFECHGYDHPLNDLYPIIYLDGLVAKVRENYRVVNKTVYLALGIVFDGQKDLLGLWIEEARLRNSGSAC